MMNGYGKCAKHAQVALACPATSNYGPRLFLLEGIDGKASFCFIKFASAPHWGSTGDFKVLAKFQGELSTDSRYSRACSSCFQKQA